MNSNTNRTIITIEETAPGKYLISTETSGHFNGMSSWPYADVMEEAERRATQYRAQGYDVEIVDERQAVR